MDGWTFTIGMQERIFFFRCRKSLVILFSDAGMHARDTYSDSTASPAQLFFFKKRRVLGLVGPRETAERRESWRNTS